MEFAKLFEVNQNTVSRWEKGKVISDEETLKKLAKYGGVTIEWLLHGQTLPATEEEYATLVKPRPGVPGPAVPALSSPVDTVVLTQIIALLEEILRKNKKDLLPARKAHFISLLYDHFQETGKPPDRIAIEEFLAHPLFKNW